MAGWIQKRIKVVLLTVSLACGGFSLYVQARAAKASRASLAFSAGRSTLEPAAPVNPGEHETHPSREVIGRVEVAAIHLAVPMLADDAEDSLQQGVGYIPGTGRPGGLGTMGLAGHRDSYFRPLRFIRPGMDIRVSDKTGAYHYQVDATEIVTPDKVQVLDTRSRPGLTLVTCYPFSYVGSAPQRFIVYAHLLSAVPDSDS